MTFCVLCEKNTEFQSVHYGEEIKIECVNTHFNCQKCGAGYSKLDHFEAHQSTHDIESFFGSVKFEKSTNPQNFEDMKNREISQEREYAQKGQMYGSAYWTDFVCCLDGLEEHFNQGLTVENALHQCALIGYDVGYFGYVLSDDEQKDHSKYAHSHGWTCHNEKCEECN